MGCKPRLAFNPKPFPEVSLQPNPGLGRLLDRKPNLQPFLEIVLQPSPGLDLQNRNCSSKLSRESSSEDRSNLEPDGRTIYDPALIQVDGFPERLRVQPGIHGDRQVRLGSAVRIGFVELLIRLPSQSNPMPTSTG